MNVHHSFMVLSCDINFVIFTHTRRLKAKQDALRQQMMQKMQNLMQAHYNETLQVNFNLKYHRSGY